MHISIELYPPDNEQGLLRLRKTAGRLAVLRPKYFSVTYGAGGSTRDSTYATITSLVEDGFNVAPHLSFGFDNEAIIEALLDRYITLGLSQLVVLRGDMSSVDNAQPPGFRIRYAEELVRFIRQRYDDHFRIGVAAYPETHPQASSPEMDLHWFQAKVEAGADLAITQYFYNCDAYEDFLNRCFGMGLDIPIIPGVMPITNYNGAVNFAKKCGTEIPRWILKRIEQYKDDEDSLRSFGIDVVTALCERLQRLPVPGLHFYALNQSKIVLAICANLGLPDG